jgi:hypothetical protein
MPYGKYGNRPLSVVNHVEYPVVPNPQAIGIEAAGEFPASMWACISGQPGDGSQDSPADARSQSVEVAMRRTG